LKGQLGENLKIFIDFGREFKKDGE